MCNPLGQEAVRVHRMLRVLAERLAGRGISVVRFDYFGTGDSAGDDEHGDLGLWCDDLLAAHQELLRRSRATRIVWLGARLGATIAALSSARANRPLDRLIAWEPVVDGAAYLEELRLAHAAALAESRGRSAVDLRTRITDEILGFGVGPTMLEQLGRLTAGDMDVAHADQIVLVQAPGHAATAALAQRLRARGVNVKSSTFEHAFDWSSEEALSTALVPAPALEMLAAHVEASGDE